MEPVGRLERYSEWERLGGRSHNKYDTPTGEESNKDREIREDSESRVLRENQSISLRESKCRLDIRESFQ